MDPIAMVEPEGGGAQAACSLFYLKRGACPSSVLFLPVTFRAVFEPVVTFWFVISALVPFSFLSATNLMGMPPMSSA